MEKYRVDVYKRQIIGNAKFIMEGVVDMEQTFYVGMKICDYYAVHINDDGYE